MNSAMYRSCRLGRRVRRIGRHIVPVLLGFVCTGMSVLAWPSLVVAQATQTRFLWPDRLPDVTRYETPEQCLAATQRIRDSVLGPRQIVAITSPRGTPESLASPRAVIDAAQQCSARWPLEHASLEIFYALFPLYLQAGRDADADSLASRRLARVAHDTGDVRFAVIDSIAAVYLYASPARISRAEPMLTLLGEIESTTDQRFRRFDHLHTLLQQSDALGDTIRAYRAAEEMTRLAAALPDADRTQEWWTRIGRFQAYTGYDYLSTQKQFDSLRISTAAYAKVVRANWAFANHESVGTVEFPVGSPAAPLQSTFVFPPVLETQSAGAPRSDVRGNALVRPAPGVISLIVFLDRCDMFVLQCLETYATIKRIASQYSELELTLSAQTYGFFFDQKPPVPKEEADLYQKWWLEFHALPAMLAVTETPFWRITDPDRRRINEVIDNRKNYSFGSWVIRPQMGVLVDRDGTIVYTNILGRMAERRFGELIRILLEDRAVHR